MGNCKAKMRRHSHWTPFLSSSSRRWLSRDGTITPSRARNQKFQRKRSTIHLILSMIAAPVTLTRRGLNALHLKSVSPFVEEDFWKESFCRNVSSSLLCRSVGLMKMEKRQSIRFPGLARCPIPNGPRKTGRRRCISQQSPTGPTAELCIPTKMKKTFDDFFNICNIRSESEEGEHTDD